MTSYQPRIITKSDPSKISVEWADGETTAIHAYELRGLCPCAQCVDEVTGVRQHDPDSVPQELQHNDVRMVGNYAISIQFSDGHNTGIFTFEFLRANATH